MPDNAASNASSPMPSLALSFQNVTLAYRDRLVLSNINGEISTGSLTAIVGANGCGKSTLIKAIAGMLKPAKGQIQHAYEKKDIAYLSQISDIDRSFPIAVFDFVASGLWQQTGAFKAVDATQMQTINNALDAVGMRAHTKQLIGELSGGQFQRIRFAQLILQNAQLMLLDEPFTGVDEHTMTDLMCLLHYWHEQGKTIMVVLHNLKLVREQFPQVIALGEQKVLSWGNTAVHLSAYQNSYKKAMIPLNTEHQNHLNSGEVA